ncbi:TPA: glycosyltransferase family 2 protein [Streptococcus suis]|nr:glycosyltransferase family 2 protein [Streptococcus suis]
MINIKRYITNRLNDVASFFTRIYVQNKKLSIGTNNSEERNQKIIASLTSYPARIDILSVTIKSILLQSMKADKVILWLGSDSQNVELPESIVKLKKYGLEIRFVEDNIMPHKKYFYAMQEFPSDIIITFDDDVIYSPFTISSLVKTHRAFPKCVCARRAHRIILEDGDMIPYSKWEFNCTSVTKPSHLLFATGVGGVLYPPKSLYKDALDISRVKNECLRADDVWLKIMETLAYTKVVWTKCLLIVPPDVKENQTLGLAQGNVNRNQNDIYMTNLEEKYHYKRIIMESCIESKKK